MESINIIPEEPNHILLNFLPPDAKLILDFGCGDGSLGKQYKQINPHGKYIGIETDRDLVKNAAQFLDGVIYTNSPQLDEFSLNINPQTVDCIIYQENFAQIRNSEELLQKQVSWLKENGQLIACIPNVQHWQRILKLMQGKWEATGENQVDALRFFTLTSIKNMFTRLGLYIFDIQRRGRHEQKDFEEFQQVFAPTLANMGIDANKFAKDTWAYQYIVRSTKTAKPPRSLFITTLIRSPSGRDRVRILDPDRFSSTIPGVRTFASQKPIDLTTPLAKEEKVFIWQAAILGYPQDLPALKTLLKQDYLMVAEFDDDPLHRPEYEQNKFLSFRGCHCVQTTNETLAKYLRELNPNVAVFPNQLTYLPAPRIYNNDDYITLFFGALLREKEWPSIMPAINRILNSYKDKVRVKVIHDRLFFDALETANKEFTPFCPLEQYEAIMHSSDIGILPLLPTRYNSMKSDLKFIQCAGHGVAVLASPTMYENSIVEGETGLLYRSPEDFELKLRELIENPKLRHSLITNAYHYVKNNRLLSQHYRQRRDWYLQMRDELPRLNAELYSRFPELFED